MIVQRPVVKKSLAVTLILAIALSLPGSAAWSQTYNASAAPGASAAGAQAAASVTGAQAGISAVPNLAVNSLSALTPSPILSAPAVTPSALVAAPAANASVIAAAAKPVTAPVAARAAAPAAAPAANASAAPAANASVIAAPLGALSRIAGESSAEVSAVEVVAIGRIFDGSKASDSAARAVPSSDLSGRGGRTFRSSGLKPSFAPAPAPAAATATQQRMLASLYQVASIFAEQYAPLDMKKERFQLDLKSEYDKAKTAILANPAITTREFQDLLAKLVASMRDYHVSISFHSTESSKLYFQVGGAEGRYFLTHIDREKLSAEAFPFQMGDEVVAFNGKPTAEAVKAIAAKMTGNTAETDMRMAEMFLTNRRRARGDNDIPKGTAEVVIRSKGQFYKVTMPWDYTPELLAQDVPLRNAGLLEPEGLIGGAAAAPASTGFINSVGKAIVAAVHPLIDLFSNMRAEASDNPFMIGARKSFVPRLGKVLWRSDEDSHFDAYIFETKDGHKKGYIRIAAYDGDNAEVREFAKVMAKFQVETDALVIDQVSNPGGSVFYLYALASHLTDVPLVAPRHRLIIGEAEAHQSAELLLKVMRDSKKSPEAKEKEQEKAKAKKAKKLKPGEEEEAPNAGGYPITAKFMALMIQSAQFILKSFNAGQRYTDLIHISGVADIDPAPKAEERYTKPILLLTNALDFSGGDFFPAIMQDNKRATILGVRTAGAGGIVKSYSVNQFGIDHLSATGSLAERANGQPIENLGVTPEIPYEITAKDLRTGFAEYRWKILKALNGMLESASAPAPAAPQGEK
ncbi:MAG: protease-like activity factor CPAF [Elusimicrobia bacterium]|nr:protease-like activity factor CPAF [Elusimicrobiota bacterium]